MKAYTARYNSYSRCEKNKTTHQKKTPLSTIVGNFVFSSFCASHFMSHVALSHCVDSTHLRIQTQPWPVWCLNQWGNQLSPPDPSGHNVPAKLGRIHEPASAVYRYPRVGMYIQIFKSSYFSPFLWRSNVISGDYLKLIARYGSKSCRKKKKNIITSQKKIPLCHASQ